MKSTVLFVGNGPATNHGCEALTRSSAIVVRHAMPQARVISSPERQDVELDSQVIKGEPILHRPMAYSKAWSAERIRFAVAKRLGSFKKYSFEPYLEDTGAVLALGGDNYTLDYGPSMPLKQMAIGEEIRQRGIPFVVWGASIGPFSADPALEKKVAQFLNSIALVTVRETKTLAYLDSIGVRENVRLVADPAFTLPISEPSLPPEIVQALKDRPVCINLSPLMAKYVAPGQNWEAVAAEFVTLVDQALEGPIFLLPHVTWTISDDHAFLSKVKAQLGKTKNPIHVIPRHLNALELKWVISKSRALVAARTHATIGAFSQAVPTLSLGYSTKAEGINLDLFGHARWLVNVKGFSPAMARDRLLDLLKEEVAVRNQLASVAPVMKQKALSAGDHLLKIMR